MSVLLSCATGNLTTAATWALVDSTSYSNSEVGNGAQTTAYQVGTTFTPGAITIDAIAVKVAQRLVSATGTISVALDQGGGTVSGTEITLNVTDLPVCALGTVDGGWIVFKFAAPVLLVAATVYGVKTKTSVNASVSLFGTTGINVNRALRTTTTQAPVAGDDLIIAGEKTGAGTSNSFVVTNNETTTTDYGSNTTSTVTPAIAICSGGTLKFKDTSAANPYLRVSGYLIVYNGGELDIGTVATPIPRDSVAILEFDCAADGDFGVIARNGSTCTMQGLSRTSGKNIVSAKLSADSSVNLLQSINLLSSAFTISAATTTLDPTGTTLGVNSIAGAFGQLISCADTVANSNHKANWSTIANVTNTTQVYTQWIKRGSGTNNRFVRLQLATATTLPAANGFYADFDLQTPSAGTCTALGNGTATSASITAFGGGFICTIIGKISSGAAAPVACIGACNASTVVSYAGDATQNFIINWPQVYTASSQPTQDTIDTDTGWLSGDVVALASTTRTAAECEVASLNGNAGASTLTYNLYPVNARSGTSPTQAEVILLTRNVKVRSSLNTAMTFINPVEGSTFAADWVEFYYIGANVSGKRGLEIGGGGTNSINVSVTHCSIHDAKNIGVLFFTAAQTAAITLLTFSNNVMWNLATSVGAGCITNIASTSTNYTIDNNILIRTGNGNGWTLADIGGTFTNNTVVGSVSSGISLAEASGNIGTFSNLVTHSCAADGIVMSASGMPGTITTHTSWRNGTSGFKFNTVQNDFVLDTPVYFGNAFNNIVVNAVCEFLIKSPIFSSDTTFTTASGIGFTVTASAAKIVIENGDFSTVSGIKTAHTSDITPISRGIHQIILRNTKLGAATQVNTTSTMSNNSFISAQKLGQVAGAHKTWMRNGTIATDSVVTNISSGISAVVSPQALSTFTAATTSGSPTITLASAFQDIPNTLAVGDLIVGAASAFPLNTTVSSISASAGTITASANAGATQASDTISYCKKLQSAPQFQGVAVPVASGWPATVSVYVRKRQENLFTFSEDFSQAAWVSTGMTVATGQIDPLGGTNATQYAEIAGNNVHQLARSSSAAIVSGATYIFSFYVKPLGGRQWFWFAENSRFTWFDLTNGVAGTTNANHTITLTADANGFYLVKIIVIAANASFSPIVASTPANGNSSSFAGTITMGFTTWGWQVEAGSTRSPYQVTTTPNQPGYNGQQPRLIQRANPAIGVNSDTVLDTMASGNAVWELLTGMSSVPTDDGAFEFVVDCDGTQGAINVQGWAIS